MGFQINNLALERRDIVLNTSNGDMHLTVAPRALTANDQAKLSLARGNGDEFLRELLRQMARLIISWDVVGPLQETVVDDETGDELVVTIVAAGEPVPPTKEYLQYIDQVTLGDIYQAIIEAVRPKETTSKPSGKLFEVKNRGSFD